MELLQLRYFAELANTEHLSKTAEKLMISPPSLSSTIKKLENELGVPLFDRSRQKMELNKNGVIFYRYVQTALNALDSGIVTLTRQHPLLRVAMTSYPVWIDMLYAYEQSHPHVELEYQVITLEQLNQPQTPFPWNFFLGIIEDIDNERFHSQKVFLSEKPVVLMSVRNPLASRSQISLEELSNENFISVGRENSSAHNFMISLCHQAGFQPKKIYYGDYLMRVKLIQQNRGVNITTMVGATVNAIPLDSIIAIPLSHPIATRTQSISWERTKFLSDIEQEFLDFAAQHFKEHPPINPQSL